MIATVMTFLLATGPAQPREGSVTTTHGALVPLRSLWGKPCVLFYEDKDGASLNRALKAELVAAGKKEGKSASARILAVANLAQFDWYPARSFAEAAIRAAELEAGIPIYADWAGELARAPWKLPARGSTVVLLDASGTEVWRASGELSRNEREVFLAALRALLG